MYEIFDEVSLENDIVRANESDRRESTDLKSLFLKAE
jgi:hypothetical protein